MSYRQEIVGDTFYWHSLYISIVDQLPSLNEQWRCRKSRDRRTVYCQNCLLW